MVNIIIGIAIGAYLFNSSIRWHTNYSIKTIVLWIIDKVRFLYDKIKDFEPKKRYLAKNTKHQTRIKHTESAKDATKGTYACSCGGVLEPVLTKGYEGYYACMDCAQVKKLKASAIK